jgi:hypothetical protein
VEGASVSRNAVLAATAPLGVTTVTTGAARVPTVEVPALRVALYQPWGGNVDEGWTRWVLEQYEFPYVTIHDDTARLGRLRDAYDVIVLPSASRAELLNGMATGTLPEQYTGGLTDAGAAHLREFVRAGGTLVALDHAARLPIRAFGLPVTDVVNALGRSRFYVPGTLMRLSVDTRHPLGWGMPEQAAAFFADSPAFAVDDLALAGAETGGQPVAVATYPEGPLALSGWAVGEEHLRGRAAVVDIPLGAGHVVLLGFQAQHRAQAHGTFKLLFNALLYGSPERREGRP